MAHLPRFTRAGAFVLPLLAAGMLSLPTSASPPLDDIPPSTSTADPGATPSPEESSSPATPTPDVALSATSQDATQSVTPEATSSPTASPSETVASAAADTSTATETESGAVVVDPSTPTADATETPSPTETDGAALVAEPSTLTADTTETPSPTETATETPTETATATSSPTATPPSVDLFAGLPSFPPGAVLINEVAWAGTLASFNDEWIELWNPGPEPIGLEGWSLTDGDGGDIREDLRGEIGPYSFYLLERTGDDTVSDVPADGVYTGSLNNSGEKLELIDPSGTLIDTANAAGGTWPAGNTSSHASMERHGLLDVPANWTTFPGIGGNGVDAYGNPIAGTPRQANAPSSPLASPTASATPTPTSTPPGTATTPFPHEAVIINEVAWAGTLASTSDEWIELLNPGSDPIDLAGWTLTDDGDINVKLLGLLPPGAYYLIERSDDETISNITADRIYPGALANDGERLRLIDPSGTEIDVVNPSGGAWPAGDASSRASMERASGRWHTFTGYYGLGLDAAGRGVRGTPRGPNSVLFPTPMPTWIPGRVVINEVLIRPHYDWEGAGGVTTADEFIELYNRGPGTVNLQGWVLDDYVVGGSSPYELPSITLEPGEFVALFRSRTHIALNDDGDSVRLSAPDGSLVDKIRYLRVKAYNLSYGRLPDGDDVLVYGLWPTPRKKNVLYTPPGPFPAGSILINEVAWAGTLASANDEWMELWNPGSAAIHLDGWVLADDNDIHVDLTGLVSPGGYVLLERTDDQTISDLRADRVYSGALADDGENLRLIDPSGAEVDFVNPGGGAWPAGDNQSRTSMERVEDGWMTFAGDFGRGLDAEGRSIRGTPGAANSVVAAIAISEALACAERGARLSRPCP
jgi:hypothetical protein